MAQIVSRPTKKQPVDLDFTLRRIFGKQKFRPVQRDVITAALEGHDVFLQAATSFGKSLCFQLPAVVDHGITIVVSPLLALINNQAAALRAANIAVATINSNTPSSERNAILDDLRCGHPLTRLLYVTPEFCLSTSFRRHLETVHSQRELSRIAIDEAHCISEWGHDFRPAYKELIWFRQALPDVPIICLTATATARVRQDVLSTLGLNPSSGSPTPSPGILKTFTTPTSRPNLHYEVRFKSDTDPAEHDQLSDFLRWLRGVHRRRRSDATTRRPTAVSGIIYTLFRRDCETLAARLRAAGIGAAAYHAGLAAGERAACQTRWLRNDAGYDVIVATTAFGMGIDKDDVRFVAHWQLPKSFEGFYQEAGRAGRDGRAALHLLYYSREDRDRAVWRMAKDEGGLAGREKGGITAAAQGRRDSLRKLVEYCEAVDRCRHRLVADYFGDESVPECDYACDFCKDVKALKRRKEEGLMSEEAVFTQSQREGFYGEGYD